MSDPSPITLAADFPLRPGFPVQRLLDAFAELAQRRDDVRLLLTGKRFADSACNVVNFIELNGLDGRIDYRPYYYHHDAPDLRRMDVRRIPRATPVGQIDSDFLSRLADGRSLPSQGPAPNVLFVTAFHPLKQEGNSTAMRVWLDHLHEAGYCVHLLYYREVEPVVGEAMREASRRRFDHYYEVAVSNALSNTNQPPLNVDVDDWCGPELLDAVGAICDQYEISDCIVNYAFDSGVFQALPPSTRKVLITHDRFVDRNRALQAQGFKDPAWVSLSRAGEKTACLRADIVVALQHLEAKYFQTLTDGQVEVIEVPPFFPKDYRPPHRYDGRLRIGYFGSTNAVNEQSLVRFIEGWEQRPTLRRDSRILVAGGTSQSLVNYLDQDRLDALGIECLGRFDELADFFAQVDVVINPESGGTGIKIKTLETLAHGCALLSTREGTVGLHSEHACHQVAGIDALLDCVAELAAGPERLEALAAHSREVYDRFWRHSHERLAQLLPPVASSPPQARDPRVSVIVPFTDDAEDLQARLDSIQQQSYPAIELILIDQGIAGRCQSIAAAAVEQASPFSAARVCRHPPDPGPAARHRSAIDTGVEQASGDYLLFLEPYQTLPATAISGLVDAATQHRVALVIGAADDDSDRDHQGTAVIASLEDLSRSGPVLPVRVGGVLLQRRLLTDHALWFGDIPDSDLTVMPLLYLLAGRVARIELTVLQHQPPPGGAAARTAGLLPLWQSLDRHIERLALQGLRADIAVQFLLRLMARLQRQQQGLPLQALYQLLEPTQGLIEQASAARRQEFAQQMPALLADIGDQATYRRFAALDSRRVLLDYYQSQLSAGERQ